MRASGGFFLAMLLAPPTIHAQTSIGSSMDRHILGQFSLRQLEDESTYILVKPTTVDSLRGELGGKVTQIGWFDKAIVAVRGDSTGGPAYFLILIRDNTESMYGPFPDLNIEAPQGFRLMEAGEAWRSLK